MTLKELEEIYNQTGINLFFALRKENMEEIDPKVFRILVWYYKKQDNPELKLEDVNDVNPQEIIDAWNRFFR